MISESEFKVMRILWQQAPCSAKTVVSELEDSSDWKEKTIKTLLNRLLNKGIITYEKNGREYLYSPLIEQEQYQKEASKNFLSQVFDGKLSAFVSQFAKKETLSTDEIKQLKKVIKELENDQ
ncbi:BlaI/MecI/CopY family transcriptional regulator [Pleionea sediminis]|uniref:BlaI/MecI/CopY family transcriptional regulator n=1 Tax=Pleionea sediminis TaxID=2569479 RepID=UPI001186C99F|nr:BlaI/MecI/CopY family transcriptional regulator [Pleionea sediminis]